MTVAAAGDPCPRCGEPLPADANFCPNCGAPVSVSDASERRVVTVVFVDLAGSTELAARLDPERFREVIAAFHGMVSEEIAWLGGVAEGFIGDAVLGVFGIPAARDDDAVRGIRAAVAVRDRAERLGEELALPIAMRVRIGVNTGPVAIGTATDRNIVIGAEVNIGARMQQAAEPDEILAGATTVQLAGGAVEFGEPRAIAAKGFEDRLRAWPVVAVRERAKADRSNIRFVDRRRELALLSEIYERAASRGRAHMVTLLGEPGIGKSRVVDEFLAGLPADDEGAERQVQPVRGGGHVLAARADGLSRAGRAARRARGRRGAEAPRGARVVARRSGGGRALGPAARASRSASARRAARTTASRRPRCVAACCRCWKGSPRARRWCSCSRTSNRRTR